MAIFSKVDADNNKALSFEEFTSLLFGYNPVLEPQSRELFGLIDMDGDGSIDYGEFLLIIEDPEKMKRDIYTKIENNRFMNNSSLFKQNEF
jgi:Ca2+-binding EF-hand superfamily protein